MGGLHRRYVENLWEADDRMTSPRWGMDKRGCISSKKLNRFQLFLLNIFIKDWDALSLYTQSAFMSFARNLKNVLEWSRIFLKQNRRPSLKWAGTLELLEVSRIVRCRSHFTTTSHFYTLQLGGRRLTTRELAIIGFTADISSSRHPRKAVTAHSAVSCYSY